MRTNKYGTPKERILKVLVTCVFIVGIFLTNGMGRKFYISQYEEECFAYKYMVENKTEYYCDSVWRHLMMCYTKTESGEWIEQVGKDISFDRSEIDCNCPIIKNRTIQVSVITDECSKYHLVRKNV